jgi:hypothetical protein
MNATRLSIGLTLCAAIVVGSTEPVIAHHSHANYDQTVTTDLVGTVQQIRWANPHTWIYLEVEVTAGEPNVWALEGGSVAHVQSFGWEREDIVVGDTIRVRCHQLKDGENGCLVRTLTGRDGVERAFD